MRVTLPFCLLSAALLLAGGCAAPPPPDVSELVRAGQYGQSRVTLHQTMVQSRKDRRYLLDRMKYAMITLADGYPQVAQLTFEEIYDVLRTQGINEDKTVQSVILNEDIKFWKGEPFEQALAMVYYSAQQASLGNWDNARAAAGNSLFRLRDFSGDKQTKHIDTEDIARRAMAYEEGVAENDKAYDSYEDYLDHGYAVRDSNFVLGYLMKAIAARQMTRQEEFLDNLRVALEIDPGIKPLADALRQGRYNTLLLVSYGLGPKKVGTGPDNALAAFTPRYASGAQPLTVSSETAPSRQWPVVCDVNAMAADHIWNNMEDVRMAKAVMGQVLMKAGTITTSYGLGSDSDEAAYAGLAMMLAGAILRAGAHVDTRYCDLMPQRFYLVPVYIDQPNTKVTLQVGGVATSRLVLTGLSRPPDGETQFRYVRLVSPGKTVSAAPAWATSGAIKYFNDSLMYTDVPDPVMRPYILGGRAVARPTPRTLAVIQSAGHLQGVTSAELEELYRAEGITWAAEDQVRKPTAHVLEGGKSILMPQPGTAGFARLFSTIHGPYQPQSQPVKQLTGP